MWGPDIDFRPLFILAMIGLIACGLAAIGSMGALIWFIMNHVQIV